MNKEYKITTQDIITVWKLIRNVPVASEDEAPHRLQQCVNAFRAYLTNYPGSRVFTHLGKFRVGKYPWDTNE